MRSCQLKDGFGTEPSSSSSPIACVYDYKAAAIGVWVLANGSFRWSLEFLPLDSKMNTGNGLSFFLKKKKNVKYRKIMRGCISGCTDGADSARGKWLKQPLQRSSH